MITLALLALSLTLGLWNAWALLTIYGWFAIPLGAPLLAFWHFYGLRMLIFMLTWKPSMDDDAGLTDTAKQIRFLILILGTSFAHGLCLVAGWAIHTFAGPF